MSINTITSSFNHPKSIIKKLKTTDDLPFKDVLSSDSIAAHVNKINYRERFFTPDITIWTFLSQVLSEDQSCQNAVAKIIAFFISQGKEAPSANTAAYCKARARLADDILSSLAKESAEKLEEETPSKWLWRNKYIKIIDGSTVSMPDTPENQAVYPQSSTQKQGVGFPIARIAVVISYATGAILDLAICPYAGKHTSEFALLRQMMHVFKPGDVAMADSYYGSYFVIAMLIRKKVDVVFPVHHARGCDFRKGKRLGNKDHIVEWKKPKKPDWMDQSTYDSFPEQLSIREVEIKKQRKGFRPKTRVIVTSFFDEKDVCRDDLNILYSCRWYVELDLRSIKDVMGMNILRGRTPQMVRKEIWAHVLAYNLIRKIMAQAAIVHGKKPRELSFKITVQITASFRQTGICSEQNYNYEKLLKAIAYKTVGNRPGRHEPKRVKRRPKPYDLLLEPRSFYHKEEKCIILS